MIAALLAIVALAGGDLGAKAQGLPSATVTYGSEVPDNTVRIVALGTGYCAHLRRCARAAHSAAALGHGTPSVTKEQAGTSYLLLLGNNSRPILLDAGTGSYTNLLATGIPLANIDTVFLSHLHSDHVTDLAPLYALANGRQQPLSIYGPSGAVPATGTAALVAGLKAFLGWDQVSRNHVSDFPPGYQGNQIVAHEFNFSKVNQLIYDQDGLKVYSNPAFHYDTPGPVSLRLEWNNITITYSGDTIPLETFVDFAHGSDVVIHESVGPVYIFNYGLPPASTNILTNHTSQQEVGAVFKKIQPRLAIVSHLDVNDYSIVPIITAIRTTFPVGPLAIAKDFNVWDVNAAAITERQFVYSRGNWGYIFQPEKATPGYKLPVGASPADPSGKLATNDDRTDPRPSVVQPGNLKVLHIARAGYTPPTASGRAAAAADSAADASG